MTSVRTEDVRDVLKRAYGEPVILASAATGDHWVAVSESGDPLTLLVADDLNEMMRKALRQWHRESGLGAVLDRLAERGCQLSYQSDGELVRVTVRKGEFEETTGATTPRGLCVRLEIAERWLDHFEERGYGPHPPRRPLP